jgi:hypothetical protein
MSGINIYSNKYRGAIECIDGVGISGWCMRKNEKPSPVKLSIVFNDEVVFELYTHKIRTDIVVGDEYANDVLLAGFSFCWKDLSKNLIDKIVVKISKINQNLFTVIAEECYELSVTWAVSNNKISSNSDILNGMNNLNFNQNNPNENVKTIAYKTPLKILLMTAHFELIAGSEIVLMELAEQLCHAHEVTIAAAMSQPPITDHAKRLNVPVIRIDKNLRPFEYDLVWVQNYLLPLCDMSESAAMVERTCFVFAHLDLGWGLAQAGLVLEPLLADRYVAHSPSGVEHLAAAGLDQAKTISFFNAAPASFFEPPRPARSLQRVALISNHPPEEILQAQLILRERGIEVVHYGIGGDIEKQRISPEILKSMDAVITIGKTVQYCLGLRIPVFIYDQFGGPGYLTKANFDKVGWFNFSGRCCHRRIAAQAIVDDIMSGYADAIQFMAGLDDGLLHKYRLDPVLDSLLALQLSVPYNRERLRQLALHQQLIERERALCSAAMHYFVSLLWITKKVNKYKEKYGDIA